MGIAALLERIENVIKATKQPRWPKGNPRGGQFRPKGGMAGVAATATSAAQRAADALAEAREALNSTINAALHPRRDDAGNTVTIDLPTAPSSRTTWRNPNSTAVFAPGSQVPATLNGVAMKPWKGPTSDAGWNKVEGMMRGKEPPLPEAFDHLGKPKRQGAGVIVAEPDGRVWIVEPTNHFGGYQNTFPKGGKEPGIKSLQANAIKEAWEESGLKVQITGVLGDYEGDTSIARYYTARRTGGTPADAGWETQGVKLVPAGQMGKHLNRARDQQIAADYLAMIGSGISKADKARAERIADAVAELLKSINQPRYPKGHPRGGQWKPKGGGIGVGGGASASAATAMAGVKAMLEQFQPAMLSGKNPDNSALKAANKKIQGIATMANAGDVAGLQKIKPTEPGKGANPYQKGVWKAWNDGVAYAKAVQQAGAGDAAPPKARAGTGPMKLSSMTYVKPKPGGSNPGGIYKDADGALWLVKGTGGNADMAKNEVLAARLYNAAGASAPEMRLVELGDQYGGGTGVASRMVEGKLSKPTTNALAENLAQEHFAHDAWLANWDAVGLDFDNIAITEKGQAMRIDPGGALLYRAQGQPKGAAFNAKATEWDTLRDPKLNPQSAAIFGKMTAGELAESAAKLSLISDDTIKKMVNDYGPGDDIKKASLADTLIARKQAVMAAGQKAQPYAYKETVKALGGDVPAAAAATAKTKPAAAPKAASQFAAEPKIKATAAGLVDEGTGKLATFYHAGAPVDDVGKLNPLTFFTADKASAESYLQSFNNANPKLHEANLVVTKPAPPEAIKAAAKKLGIKPDDVGVPEEFQAGYEYLSPHLNTKAKLVMNELVKQGYDGAHFKTDFSLDGKMMPGGSWVAFNSSQVKPAGSKATAAAVAGAALAKPAFTGQAKKWNAYAGTFDSIMAEGNTATAANYAKQIANAHADVKSKNHEVFQAYVAAKLGNAASPGAAPAPTSARAKATAAVEAASAAAAVKPKASSTVAPAMPAKPPAAALSSAANPNKTLLGKVDQVEAIAAQHAAGKLSKDEATMQLAGITFGSNTYGKKAAAYKADVIAALGGTPPIAPKATTPKAKATLATAQAASVAAAATAAASKTKAPKFNPARLTEEPDFMNWQGTGKGLSSKPEINKANQDEVKAIKAIAATGNLTALKAYQPKSPSKHVASYLQQVVEDVNIQLNPPPRLSSIKVGGGKTMEQSIKALAEAAKPLENPSQVLNKLAIYPVLGKAEAPASAKPPQILKFKAGLTETTYALESSKNFVKLDSVKQNAVIAYTGSSYHDINSSFRSGKPSTQALNADAGIREAGVYLKPGTVLSRKVGMSDDMVAQLQKHGTGKIIQEFGISSTSISPQVWSGNVHLRMTAGPKVKGLYAGNMSNNGKNIPISKHPNELEMLLPANQRMLITGISKGTQPDGYGSGAALLVDVTLLPND